LAQIIDDFFNLLEDTQFLAEARRISVEPIMFFLTDPSERSAVVAAFLAEHYPDITMVGVNNEGGAPLGEAALELLASYPTAPRIGANASVRLPRARANVLARRWWLWALAAAVSGALAAGLVIAMLILKESAHPILVYASLAAFVLSCATLCFALLAIFTRFVRRSNPILDSLAANSYGIYIVHYVFVAWLQFALLHASLAAAEKWGVVAVLAYAASWLATAAARRLPGVARIV
jgi:hypothetical protein